MTTSRAEAPASRPRTRGERVVDRTLSWMLRLPRPSTEYSVTAAVAVPMRDGVELVADLYAPDSESRGTLLVRGPYGRGAPHSILFARLYAERGYHVLLQSCRGTFGSGDAFQPMRREVDDGADTVVWMRAQPWFNGRFATIGMSYLGFTQWALLADPPDELAAAVVIVGPHDFSRAVHGTGAFTLSDFLGWCDTVGRQEEVGPMRGMLDAATSSRRLAPAVGSLPLGEAAAQVLGGRAPWFGDWLSHDDLGDGFWRDMQLDRALDRVAAPVLLIGGWQDLFLEQTIEQYLHLSGRGADVALTIGPWTHLEAISRGAGTVTRESLDWLATHLAGDRDLGRAAPVRFFVTGAGQWREHPSWPPPSIEQTWYLQPGGQLGSEPPRAGAPGSRFTYDPADPTPTVGGRLLSAAAGYRKQGDLEQRDDVLTFTGPVLAGDVEVIGSPVVELAHRTDNPQADLFARLCDVDAKGRSRNVSETFRRLDPERADGVIRLELDPAAHRFRAGQRVRLQISGGSHPRYARNLGTGEPAATAERLVPSRRTIAHGAGGASRLVLPVALSPGG